MKVLTLEPKQFSAACRELAGQVGAASFVPGMVVGIQSGGEYVAREVIAAFPGAMLSLVGLQRPSTSRKSLLQPLFRHLPLRMLDLLRMAESRILALRPRRHIPRIEIDPSLRAMLPSRVLVVDDAVDSGATMAAVVDALRRACPDIEVRTAVITVTTRRPAVMPDFALYKDNTLIRFPWSMDMKK